MYKAVVADDERIIRNWLSSKIPWNSLGFEMVGDYEDGEDALEGIISVKPDLLVTDVKMPVMDGIELVSRLRKSGCHLKIVIISGFDEFSYAKAAMQNGVSDYILKPVEINEICSCIEKIKEQLDEEKRKNNAFTRAIEVYEESKKYKEAVLIQRLIRGGEVEEPVLDARLQEIFMDEKEYCLFSILPDGLMTGDVQLLKENILDGILNNINLCFRNFQFHIFLERESILVLLSWTHPISMNMEILVKLAKRTKNVVDRFLAPHGMTVSAGVSGIHRKPEELGMAHKEVSSTVDYRFYYGKGGINAFAALDEEFKEDILVMPDQEKEIFSFLTLGDVAMMDKGINALCTSIAGQKKFTKNTAVRYFQQLITISADKILRLDNVNIERLKSVKILCDSLPNCDTIKDLGEVVIKAFNILAGIILDMRNASRINIQDVLSYIKENITRSNLDLNQVANYAHLSAKHFSVVFKQETGMNFIDYVTEQKILKALELLETTRKTVIEISSMLGFNDFKYFCKLFKKEAGLTPTQYRRRKA